MASSSNRSWWAPKAVKGGGSGVETGRLEGGGGGGSGSGTSPLTALFSFGKSKRPSTATAAPGSRPKPQAHTIASIRPRSSTSAQAPFQAKYERSLFAPDETDPFASGKAFHFNPDLLPPKLPSARTTRTTSDASTHGIPVIRRELIPTPAPDKRVSTASDPARPSYELDRRPEPTRIHSQSSSLNSRHHQRITTSKPSSVHRPSQLKVEAITSGLETDSSSEFSETDRFDFGYDDMEDESTTLHRSVARIGALFFTPEPLTPTESVTRHSEHTFMDDTLRPPATRSRRAIMSGGSYVWAFDQANDPQEIKPKSNKYSDEFDRSTSPFTIPGSLPGTPLVTSFPTGKSPPTTHFVRQVPSASVVLQPSPLVDIVLTDDEDDEDDDLGGYFSGRSEVPTPVQRGRSSEEVLPPHKSAVAIPIHRSPVASSPIPSPTSPLVFRRDRSPSAPAERHLASKPPISMPSLLLPPGKQSRPGSSKGEDPALADAIGQFRRLPSASRLVEARQTANTKPKSPPEPTPRTESARSLDIGSRLDVTVKSPKKQRSFQHPTPDVPPLPAIVKLKQSGTVPSSRNPTSAMPHINSFASSSSSTFSSSASESPPAAAEIHQAFLRSAIKTSIVSVGPAIHPSPRKRGFFGGRVDKRPDTADIVRRVNSSSSSASVKRPGTAEPDLTSRSRADVMTRPRAPIAVSVSVTVSAKPVDDDVRSIISFGDEVLHGRRSEEWVDGEPLARPLGSVSTEGSFWDEHFPDQPSPTTSSTMWHHQDAVHHIVSPKKLLRMEYDEPLFSGSRHGSLSTSSGTQSTWPDHETHTLFSPTLPQLSAPQRTSAPPPLKMPVRSASVVSKASSVPNRTDRRPSTSSHVGSISSPLASPLSTASFSPLTAYSSPSTTDPSLLIRKPGTPYTSSTESSLLLRKPIGSGSNRSLPPPPRPRLPSLQPAIGNGIIPSTGRQRSGTVSTIGSTSSKITLGGALSPPPPRRNPRPSPNPYPSPAEAPTATIAVPQRRPQNLERNQSLRKQPSFLFIDDNDSDDEEHRRVPNFANVDPSAMGFRDSAFGMSNLLSSSFGVPGSSPAEFAAYGMRLQEVQRPLQPQEAVVNPRARRMSILDSSFLDLDSKGSMDTVRGEELIASYR